MIQKIFFILILVVGLIVSSGYLMANNRCFGCQGGTFVQYNGKADNAARKKAEACGCKVTGTVACPANKKKILCTVN